jgi:hypothetical protein
MKSIIIVLCAALLFNAFPVFSAGAAGEELRREAFFRGGDAIRTALNARPDNQPLVVARNIAEPIPASPPARAPQEKPKSGAKSKLMWAGLIAGFTVSGILIYHYATGPGASVRNCSTCK